MADKKGFRSAYNFAHERTKTPTGSAFKKEYGYEIDKYGRKILVETGETNLYASIQESLEETKIENILKRAAIGDNSWMRPDGIYEDITEMPSNLIEARQAMQKLENLWAEIPIELKNKYNNNVEEFIGASGSEGWLRDMGLLQDPIPETPKEIKTTETKEGEA